MKSKLAAIVLMVLIGQVANATTVGTYLEARKKSDPAMTTLVYIMGLSQGFSWANAMLSNQGKPELFCVPSTLPLGAEAHADILDRALKNHPQKDESPIEPVLLFALMETFPCEASK